MSAQLERIERIIDTAAIAKRIELLLPVGVRPRQLKVRTLMIGMVLAMLAGRDALLTDVLEALLELPEADQLRLGVIAGELRALRGSGVVGRADGVLVVVSGRRARSVPVLCRYRQPLLTAARFAREQLICGGREPGRRDVTDELCRALSADSSLPRLQSGRLRSSWLVACAGQIGLGAFMQAAGISCSQLLGDLAAQLPAATERQLVALLGGPA